MTLLVLAAGAVAMGSGPSSCSGASPEGLALPSGITALRVQAAVTSGLPNPRWTLEGPEAGEGLRRLSGLAAADLAEPPGGLGYSGLRLELLRGQEVASSFRVYEGGVWRESVPAGAFADPGRALERWLVATAPPEVRDRIRIPDGESDSTRR